MAVEETASLVEALIAEESERNGGLNHKYELTSAHTVDQDSWRQVGLMLVTAFNCGYILSYSNLIMVALGWKWGIICTLVMAFNTAYANWLLASFLFINGQRFIRYRDLMGFLYGRQIYHVTWLMQYLTILLSNMGMILLGAKALKEMSSELNDKSHLRLQYYIIFTGVAYFIYAFLTPTMSAIRYWLGISTILTFTYVKSNRNKNYEVSGSTVVKVFNAFNAISAIVVSNCAGVLLEIQPAVKNMRKAVYLQFTVGLMFYYGVTIVGCWAYGSTVSSYLPNDRSATKLVKILINSAVFLQNIISQHTFLAPIHESLDTKFLKLDESMYSRPNMKRRFYLRALILFSGNTFVTAAFPFIGDFVNLTGSCTLIPLSFLFPRMIQVKVMGERAETHKKVWSYYNIVFFTILTLVTAIAAVSSIVKNIGDYSFFADI